jgi:hypothetical protein
VGGLKETIMGSTSLAVKPVPEEVEGRSRAYGVAVDHATFRVVDMGAKGTGYSVHLAGSIDDPWIRGFRSVQGDSRLFSRFLLDPRSWTIFFLRHEDDAPADVIAALEALDSCVDRVNWFAAL